MELSLRDGEQKVLVDADVFDELQHVKLYRHAPDFVTFWHAGDKKQYLLHRYIMGDPKGQRVEFISGDVLDCRRENLRIKPKVIKEKKVKKLPPPITQMDKPEIIEYRPCCADVEIQSPAFELPLTNTDGRVLVDEDIFRKFQGVKIWASLAASKKYTTFQEGDIKVTIESNDPTTTVPKYSQPMFYDRENRKIVALHRYIMALDNPDLDPCAVVTHRNGNQFDCRRENLYLSARATHVKKPKFILRIISYEIS